MQALGGLFEAKVGAGLTFLSGGYAAPVGSGMIVHGMDHCAAGMNTVVSGNPTETITSQAIQQTGVSQNTAEFVDNTISMVGSMGAKALTQSGQLANPQVLKSTPNLPSTGQTHVNYSPNRFDIAAKNLSEVGKNNIRILRGWARSKGWAQEKNCAGKPERWGLYQGDRFEWRLRIKPEPSARPGLDQGSNLPRFDARLQSGGQDYINPFNGQVGGETIGTHLPLEFKY